MISILAAADGVDAALTALVTVLVMAGWIAAIFVCALLWRIAADWVEGHVPHRRTTAVRRGLVDVDSRRSGRELPVRSRRSA